MKIKSTQILATMTACLVWPISHLAAAPGGGHISSRGNSAFGRSQAGFPQTGSANSQYGRTTAAQARDDSSDSGDRRKKRKKAKSAKAVTTASGNSAFGHGQGNADTRTEGNQNSRFGRAEATAAKEGHAKPAKKTQATNSKSQAEPGNSAFGHGQSDPETRTTGRQNSQFGRARADQAKAGHPTPSPSPAP